MIDAHFHIWKLDRGDYGWLTPALQPIYRDVKVENWKQQSRPCGVDRGIIVQAAPTEAETLYILDQAARHPEEVLGVVGWLDMMAPDAPQRVRQLAANRLLRGLRPMLQDIAEPDWILKPELRAALQTMCEAQLTFDALVKPIHLPRIVTLAERFPQLRIVIDHSAKPEIASGAFYLWAKDLERIASQSTAYCKLSGLLTEAGPNPDAERIERYVKHVLNVFGPDRVLWGSDWPVLELAGTYETWHTIAWSLVPESQHERVFEGTARNAYGLS